MRTVVIGMLLSICAGCAIASYEDGTGKKVKYTAAFRSLKDVEVRDGDKYLKLGEAKTDSGAMLEALNNVTEVAKDLAK